MKFSLALSVLILAIGASLSWHHSQQLAVLRENRTKIAAEAATLGISHDPSRRTDPVRVSKHERKNKEATATTVLAEFAAFIKEMEASGKSLDSLDEADNGRMKEIMARFSSLDPAQLKTLVSEVYAAKDLKGEGREMILRHALFQLAADHPQTALALFTQLPDVLNDDITRNYLVSSSLTKWATADPMAALKWVRENATKFPDLVTDRAKESMLSGIATHDPKLAFKLVGELGLKDTWQALCKISYSSKTSEGRTATLATLREFLANTPEDERFRALIAQFTGSIASEGFASATQWFTGADYTSSELEIATNELFGYIKPEETSQWIQWVSEKLPAEKSGGPISNIVRRWTENDYQAAGKWLATTPASPTKNAAVRSYAEAVSAYDPATATQWAMTLPPGPDRDATLKHIQDHSPAK